MCLHFQSSATLKRAQTDSSTLSYVYYQFPRTFACLCFCQAIYYTIVQFCYHINRYSLFMLFIYWQSILIVTLLHNKLYSRCICQAYSIFYNCALYDTTLLIHFSCSMLLRCHANLGSWQILNKWLAFPSHNLCLCVVMDVKMWLKPKLLCDCIFSYTEDVRLVNSPPARSVSCFSLPAQTQ